jgi:hypothetical protein
MLPATALDDRDWEGPSAGGWTVMGRLRQRQARMRPSPAALGRRAAAGEDASIKYGLIMTASTMGGWEDQLRAASRGGPTVLAFLFALPESEVIHSLDVSGEYFDIRTGATWDLFFPGYCRAADRSSGEYAGRRARGQPVGGERFVADWRFSPHDFDLFCRDVERESGGRWSYSGDADLVLVNGWLEPWGEPTIDWESTMSGTVGPRGQATLGSVIAKMTRDLVDGREDPYYGVGDVVAPGRSDERGGISMNEFMLAALLAIAADLGVKAVGG